jgi:hypothetical protein
MATGSAGDFQPGAAYPSYQQYALQQLQAQTLSSTHLNALPQWTTYSAGIAVSTPNIMKKFMRLNEEMIKYDHNVAYQEPLDELRISVSEWLGKA